MKKGKTSKIQGFKKTKVNYGTVDSMEMKSIYITLQSWVQPVEYQENWQRIILNLSRSIKHTIHDILNRDLFKENFIVDLDLKSSGVMENKKSFLNLDVTFFLKEKMIDFKSKIIKDELKRVSQYIVYENFDKNKYFTFHQNKKEKEETEN